MEHNSFLEINRFTECGKSVLCSPGIQRIPRETRGWHSTGIVFYFYFSWLSLHAIMTSRDELDIRKSLDPSPDQNIDMKNSDVDKDKLLVFLLIHLEMSWPILELQHP